MSDDYQDADSNDEPPHKRRKTGNNSYVDVPGDIEAEDDEDLNDEEEEVRPIEEDDLDGFIANEDDIVAEREAERRRKRKRRRKKKKKRHRNAPISEDTLRMLAEQRGENFKPDIDIGQGLSDDDSPSEEDSDDSDGGGATQRRVLKKRVMEFDEESVMGTHTDGHEEDDDFHDYGDHESVAGSLYSSHHRDISNHHNHNHHRDDRAQNVDDFVVNDMNQTGRYANYYENDQIDKLYTIFGKNIYDFLGIPTNQMMDEDIEEEKDEHLIEIEKQRKLQEAKKSEQKLKDFKRGLEGLDPKQKQKVMEIINTDIPERLQERIEKTDDEQITEIALNKEAQWISSQPYFMKLRALNRPISNEVIIIFLKYFRIDYYDVPYIVTYLRDEYPLDIEREDIWKMDELDEKYQQIYLRKRNIEMYLQQIMEKLTEHKEDKEAMRWLERVEEAKMYLYDASTHHELEAVDMFLNIVPTSVRSEDVLLTTEGGENGTESKEQYPDAPSELLCVDALDLVDRYGPLTSDRSELENVLAEVNDKLISNPSQQELRQMELETDELNKLKNFYIDCMNDIENAADKDIDSEEFQGDEAFQFFGCSQTDLEELDDSIRRITSRIAQLETEKQRIEDEFEIQKTDYEQLQQYYAKCIEIMPSIRKTKKAASMVRNGKNTGRGRGAFKLSVSQQLLPLCRNIGFSKIVSDNVKNCGQLHGGLGLRSDLLSNVVVEQTELNEICEEISSENISKYTSTEDVITECVYHLARHIGHEPNIKTWLLQQIEEHGVISTQPTLKGRDLIEWTDELACVKRLSDKPIARFLNTEEKEGEPKLHWLLIHKGTKQGLLRNHISIASETVRDIRSSYGSVSPFIDIESHYYNADDTIKFFLYKLAPMFISESSKSEWKALKLRILHDALNLYLVPWAVKWVGHKMLEHDEDSVIHDACAELKFLANVAGERDNLSSTKNILSMIVGEENSPSFLVLLNHFGDVIDETMLHYMKTHIRLNPNQNNNNNNSAASGNNNNNNTMVSTHDRLQLEKKNGDLKLFREFVEQHKPELIVIDAGNLLARNFKADIEKVLASNDYCTNLRVLFVDPCVSLLYRNSDDAIKEFQSWSVCQRQAVSLGRFVLDPITELSKRWCVDSRTGRNELLSLPLHRNMTDIAPQKLLTAFRKVLMDIVADCGVQINLCSQRDFLNGPIQFISGLGPRKAKNLMFRLKQRGTFSSRAEILRRNVLNARVYRNAIGFLRINHLMQSSSNRHETASDDDEASDDEERDHERDHNLLDDTRIHPEDYHWATVVVISAMDIDEESAYSNETLVRLRRAENLNKLEILNLDIFAERIRRRRNQRIVNKLYLIKQEVRCGFKEMRCAFRTPSEDELFHLLAGRTRASLREGMLVNVEIKSITASGIKCKLPSCGLDAWLPAENISTEIRDEFQTIKNAHHQDIQSDACRTERKDLILSFLKQKTHLEARVISIDKGKFNVKLSCLQSDIVDNQNQHQVPLNGDAYLVRNHPDDDSRKAVDKARRAAIRNRPLHRNIKYAAFFNISRDEAISKLRQSKGCGQLIFRPSSRGLNYLSMTWKMADNPDIFVHYVIAEKDKPNPYAVGKQLIVGKEVYDDLDEIYTHHKPRLNELSQMMIQHKNFRYGTENDITEMLHDEINVNHKTCYALSYSYRHPGHFLLSYIIHNSSTQSMQPKANSATQPKVHKEYVGLTYAGYKFRSHYFDDPSKLINWFKANFKRNHPKYCGNSNNNPKKHNNIKPMKSSATKPPPPAMINHHHSHPHSLNDDHDVMFNNNQNNHSRQQRSRSREHQYNNNGYNNGYHHNNHHRY